MNKLKGNEKDVEERIEEGSVQEWRRGEDERVTNEKRRGNKEERRGEEKGTGGKK